MAPATCSIASSTDRAQSSLGSRTAPTALTLGVVSVTSSQEPPGFGEPGLGERALPHRTLFAIYLAVQAAVGAAWWLAMATVPAVRSWFELLPERRASLDAFFFADAIIFLGGSALGSWGVRHGRPWAIVATWFTAGGLTYGAVYLLSWTIIGGTGITGLLPLVVAAALTTTIATQLTRAN